LARLDDGTAYRPGHLTADLVPRLLLQIEADQDLAIALEMLFTYARAICDSAGDRDLLG
jgi:hypothetical protein